MNSLRPLRRLMRHGTLPQLAAFVAVVRLGSVTRAAEGLFMAQPTVSGHLAKLSEAAGHPLLENRDRRLRPTAAGLVLYEAAVEVFARLQEAEALLGSPERMADLSLAGSGGADPVAVSHGAQLERPSAGLAPAGWPLPGHVPALACAPRHPGVESAGQADAILPRGLQDEEIRPCTPASLPAHPHAQPSHHSGGTAVPVLITGVVQP